VRGNAGPWLINSWMTSLRATRPFAALHTGAPSAGDPTATEVVGAWYARKAFLWDALDDTAVANAAPVRWTAMPAFTLAGVAVYTAATGASLMLWCPYVTPVAIAANGTLTYAAHDIYVELI